MKTPNHCYEKNECSFQARTLPNSLAFKWDRSKGKHETEGEESREKETKRKTRSSYFDVLIRTGGFLLDASIAFKLSDKSHLVHYKWNSTDEALIKSVAGKCICSDFDMRSMEMNKINREKRTKSKVLAHERIAGMIMPLPNMLHR